ncbi:OLC1v1014191C1 [Oldenlandia corymbosa var. corymbosa]|uniref:OLC1v1014191C1 n=1 Tax=Oldenlandia corymbosa var. corymbosa TaxID=529605 RepID=A0AAV1E2A2_OLDCO|nr:OLC1v1014191C1 [Oldenlandia corymbosa var. corymbosa]
MALSTAKLSEMPLQLPPQFLSSYSAAPRKHSVSIFFLRPFCSSSSSSSSSLRPNGTPTKPLPNRDFAKSNASKYSSSWLNKWPSQSPLPPVHYKNPRTVQPELQSSRVDKDDSDPPRTSAIERIVLRLRNLGLGSDDEDDDEIAEPGLDLGGGGGNDVVGWADGEEKLGDLLKRDWVRPDTLLVEDEEDPDSILLPWEREAEGGGGGRAAAQAEEESRSKRKTPKAPTLAELTIEDEELRRLRRMGMTLRERINVAKAGVTGEVLEKIHEKWRKNELVRLKFHESLANDMRTAHQIVERRTGGLVIWRSGSVMVVYRGANYEGPFSRAQSVGGEGETLFIPDVSSSGNPLTKNGGNVHPTEKPKLPVPVPLSVENMTEEELEYNSLLDGLGPRFEDWWGTGILPVDADLLPQTVPGYKTPFRLLPVGMRSRLTNAELTSLRKLAKSLPCHFALGRNRHHQGLAAAIVKLWEKSLVVKIAVKRGIQNTNNKLMSEELKMLTGGVLLLRNKYFIIMYRGKDFLPPSVAAALTERQEMTKQSQDIEEEVRIKPINAAPEGEDGKVLAGTLAEFYEAQARWGREISEEDRERMIQEAAREKTARVVKRLEHKLSLAQAKKQKAEKLLAKIVSTWIPADPDNDQEMITDEEKAMFRKVGLRMKPYLPLGIRGVFDGVIENMHLHWKHRELVKLLSKEKVLAFVEETAKLLEYESGGLLVAIEKVPKGYVLIFYRGKNYRRPVSLRPRNLLTKAKALKRRVALQRYEALSQHIEELERNIEQIQGQIGDSRDGVNLETANSGDFDLSDDLSEFTDSEDEASLVSEDGEDEDLDWEDDSDSDIAMEDYDYTFAKG